jgi:hypothetical protein
MAAKAKAPKTGQPVTILRRYTSLASLLALLQDKKLTLLSPGFWEDRNDAFYMSQYKTRKDLKTLLALCFSESDETYHHWRVFTHGADGVCIHFKREALLAALPLGHQLTAGPVTYRKIADLPRQKPRLEQLPFLKRQPYGDECEFRLVYEDKKTEMETRAFAVPIRTIARVTLNPWLSSPLAAAVKRAIRSTPGCSALKVYQTTLLENETWKKAAMNV